MTHSFLSSRHPPGTHGPSQLEPGCLLEVRYGIHASRETSWYETPDGCCARPSAAGTSQRCSRSQRYSALRPICSVGTAGMTATTAQSTLACAALLSTKASGANEVRGADIHRTSLQTSLRPRPEVRRLNATHRPLSSTCCTTTSSFSCKYLLTSLSRLSGTEAANLLRTPPPLDLPTRRALPQRTSNLRYPCGFGSLRWTLKLDEVQKSQSSRAHRAVQGGEGAGSACCLGASSEGTMNLRRPRLAG